MDGVASGEPLYLHPTPKPKTLNDELDIRKPGHLRFRGNIDAQVCIHYGNNCSLGRRLLEVLLMEYSADANLPAQVMIPPYEREIYVIAMIKKKILDHCSSGGRENTPQDPVQ